MWNKKETDTKKSWWQKINKKETRHKKYISKYWQNKNIFKKIDKEQKYNHKHVRRYHRGRDSTTTSMSGDITEDVTIQSKVCLGISWSTTQYNH